MAQSTLNQFVTQAALEKAEKIVEKERTLQMSEKTAAWFFDLLDTPRAITTTSTAASGHHPGSAKIVGFGFSGVRDTIAAPRNRAVMENSLIP